MPSDFFTQPILNSPYEYPARHWELDETGQPTQRIVEKRRPARFIYVKNHGLGFEVPYRYGAESRRYLPDFIVLVDDGKGWDDPLHLVVEIKGYRGEDAKVKKTTMDAYWTPGVNRLGSFRRWAFAEFTEVSQIQSDFEAKVEEAFEEMVAGVAGPLRAWARVIEGTRLSGPHELKRIFPHASIVGDWRTVFNVGGNKYRLIVDMRYDLGRVYVRAVMTREEYDRIDVTKV